VSADYFHGSDGRLNSSLVIAVFFASVAICTRPTTLPLWMYLGADHTVRTIRNRGIASAVRVVVTGVVTL
jgi:phosphatidylinositol glycan class B